MGTRDRWAIGGVIGAVAIATVVALAGTRRERPRLQVQTADVSSGPIARRVLVSGTLEPARMVEVGSQVSGTIASLRADARERARPGDQGGGAERGEPVPPTEPVEEEGAGT